MNSQTFQCFKAKRIVGTSSRCVTGYNLMTGWNNLINVSSHIVKPCISSRTSSTPISLNFEQRGMLPSVRDFSQFSHTTDFLCSNSSFKTEYFFCARLLYSVVIQERFHNCNVICGILKFAINLPKFFCTYSSE